MKLQTILASAILSTVVGFSAQAACGGGGYSNSSTTTTQTYAQPHQSQQYQGQQYQRQQVNSGPSTNFDAGYFHRMSGRLQLSGEQAASVIRVLNEIRNAPANSKDFDPKKEFEARLATILNPQQLRTYNDSSRVASSH